jgi:uncharacterized protein (TIGR02147 family)
MLPNALPLLFLRGISPPMQLQKGKQSPATKVQWLESDFLKRKTANKSYSLRSYAKFLEIPPGRLSEILSGKRKLTDSLSKKLASKLGLSPRQMSVFLNGKETGNAQQMDSNYHLLEEDSFALIAQGNHNTFLALMDLTKFRSEPSWVAKKMGISTLEVRGIIHRLERLGLIQKSRFGFVKREKNLQTSDGIASAALRKSHRESILQAADCLETIPLEERDITSITMAIDSAKIPLAKSLIREFRYKMADLLESGQTDEVYNLNIQLVPVTKKESKI